MYPSPGFVHCGSCVSLGGPGVPDRVSPGPVSFPIARAVTVSVRLCLARFLLFLLCAFIHVLFAPACLGGRQNRAGRSAFQGPVGHVGLHDSPKSATRSSQPPLQRPPAPLALHGFGEMPQFWREAAVLARCRDFDETPDLLRNREADNRCAAGAGCCQRPISRDARSILGRICSLRP